MYQFKSLLVVVTLFNYCLSQSCPVSPVAICQYVDTTGLGVRSFAVGGTVSEGSFAFAVNVNIDVDGIVVVNPIVTTTSTQTTTTAPVENPTPIPNNPTTPVVSPVVESPVVTPSVIPSRSSSSVTPSSSDPPGSSDPPSSSDPPGEPLPSEDRIIEIEKWLETFPVPDTLDFHDDVRPTTDPYIPTEEDKIIDEEGNNATLSKHKKRMFGLVNNGLKTYYRFRRGSVIGVYVRPEPELVNGTNMTKSELSSIAVVRSIFNWNQLNMGVSLSYSVNPNSLIKVIGGVKATYENGENVLADCNGPYGRVQTLTVYDLAVAESYRNSIYQVMTHELGHALGFDHAEVSTSPEANGDPLDNPGTPIMGAILSPSLVLNISAQETRDARAMYRKFQPTKFGDYPVVLIPTQCNGQCSYCRNGVCIKK